MKIDIFPHFIPAEYKEALFKRGNENFHSARWDVVINGTPALYDLDSRLRLIEKHEGLRQVLTLSAPPVELVADPEDAAYLAKVANDGLAELVAKYPDKFAGAAACLPMNNMDAALKETDRAIKDLKLQGVQIYTPIAGKPLDLPEFIPLYEKMAQYDLPIWIHPGVSRAKRRAALMISSAGTQVISETFSGVYSATLSLSLSKPPVQLLTKSLS